MTKLANKYVDNDKLHLLLDVGSCDINGTYRPIFTGNRKNCVYIGVDIEKGKSVDLVVDKEFEWVNFSDNTFDIVICGQVMEHTCNPWKLAKTIYRVCKPGGYAFVIAPWKCGYHPFPKDYWRIMQDGMEYLMCEFAGFTKLECYMNINDTVFAGRKGAK